MRVHLAISLFMVLLVTDCQKSVPIRANQWYFFDGVIDEDERVGITRQLIIDNGLLIDPMDSLTGLPVLMSSDSIGIPVSQAPIEYYKLPYKLVRVGDWVLIETDEAGSRGFMFCDSPSKELLKRSSSYDSPFQKIEFKVGQVIDESEFVEVSDLYPDVSPTGLVRAYSPPGDPTIVLQTIDATVFEVDKIMFDQSDYDDWLQTVSSQLRQDADTLVYSVDLVQESYKWIEDGRLILLGPATHEESVTEALKNQNPLVSPIKKDYLKKLSALPKDYYKLYVVDIAFKQFLSNRNLFNAKNK